jgi:hypothetical protein
MAVPNLVPIDAVASALGVTVPAVRNWVNDGKIPQDTYIKMGNTYRFDLERILKILLYKVEAMPEEKPVTPHPVTVVVTDDNLDLDL